MKRLAMISVLALTFTACGGDQFQSDAVLSAVEDAGRDAWSVSDQEVVEVARDFCSEKNDQVFDIAVAMSDASESLMTRYIRLGCPWRFDD